MKLKIKVTKEIIEKAKYCGTVSNLHTGQNCAVALAVRDIFPKAWVTRILILPFPTIIETVWGKSVDIDVPERIVLDVQTTNFIDNFDTYKPEDRHKLPEYKFEVEVPQIIIDRINIEDITKSRTLELV